MSSYLIYGFKRTTPSSVPLFWVGSDFLLFNGQIILYCLGIRKSDKTAARSCSEIHCLLLPVCGSAFPINLRLSSALVAPLSRTLPSRLISPAGAPWNSTPVVHLRFFFLSFPDLFHSGGRRGGKSNKSSRISFTSPPALLSSRVCFAPLLTGG